MLIIMRRIACLAVLALSGSLYAIDFQGLGDLPGGFFASGAGAMSSDGSVIVGSSSSGNGQEAFRWTKQDGMVPLGDLPGGEFASIPTAVSGDGSVIVGIGSISATNHHLNAAFRWTIGSGLTGLSSSSDGLTYTTLSTDISKDGSVIVGKANPSFQGTSMGGVMFGDKPCYWVEDQLHVLTPPGYNSFSGAQAQAVSADGHVILIQTTYNAGYLWSESEGYVPLPAEAIGANLISGDAAVLGISGRGTTPSQLWSQTGGFVEIETPAGWYENHLSSMNSDGSVVGGQLFSEAYWTGNDPQETAAYVWDELNGTRLVADLLAGYGIDLTGWNLRGVSDISDDGRMICGWGVNPAGYGEGWVATIPEPATVLLMLGGTVWALRRRK